MTGIAKLKSISKKNGGKGFRVSFIGLIVIIAAIIGIYFLSLFILRQSVAREKIASGIYGSGLSPVLNEIDLNAGEILIANHEHLSMYLNTETLDVIIKSDNSSREFHAIPQMSDLPAQAISPMVIKYLGEDNTLREWNAYTNVIQNKTYSINSIENGVQVKLDFCETDTYRLNEHMPQIISAERYAECFTDAIDKLEETGAITTDKAASFRSALRNTYLYDDNNDSYYNKFAGLPLISIIKLLIELADAVGYTTEMLIDDSAEFNITVEITEPASFTVYMEITLDNGDLLINVPLYEQVSGNDFYTLQNVTVYTAFDAAVDDINSGYIFVPDGSGMLFELDSYNSKYPEYYRPVYNNTLYDTMYFKTEYDEDLHLPVYGMYRYDNSNTSSGFFAIIESGAELSSIGVKLKSYDIATGGGVYNSVYSAVDAAQYSRVPIFGPYSSEEARFLVSTGVIPVDYKVRYSFFFEGADYYTFSEYYKDYLTEQYQTQTQFDNRPKMYIEMLGAITILDYFMGVPVDKAVSMTNYTQAMDIMDSLSDNNIVVNYKYGFNGGKMNVFGNKANLVGVNGTTAELDKFLARNSTSSEIFFEADLLRVYDTQKIYDSSQFYLVNYDGDEDNVYFNDVWFPDNTFYGPYQYAFYTLIHPYYLNGVVDGFLSASKKFTNITLSDFGNQYYANYNPRDTINPVAANQDYLLNNLQKAASEKTLALDNPNADKMIYAKYALNVSRESSDYGGSYSSVPFRQLVMSGLTEFTTLDANAARSGNEYFLLQALELGAIPKFTVCTENTDILMKARISQYFNHIYSTLEDDIKSLYNEYETAFEKIGTKEIKNHEMIIPNVFVTTYANDVKVLVNYNRYEVSVGDYILPEYGYEIIPVGINPVFRIIDETEVEA